MAPAPVLGIHQQIRLRTPGDLIWGAAVIVRGSIWCVLLIGVELLLVLLLLLDCLAYEVCLAGGNGGIR